MKKPEAEHPAERLNKPPNSEEEEESMPHTLSQWPGNVQMKVGALERSLCCHPNFPAGAPVFSKSEAKPLSLRSSGGLRCEKQRPSLHTRDSHFIVRVPETQRAEIEVVPFKIPQNLEWQTALTGNRF